METRRERGTGSIFKPKYKVKATGEVKESRHFWIQFYRDGTRFMQNTHTDKITIARRLLTKKLGTEHFIRPQLEKVRIGELVESLFHHYEVNKPKSAQKARERWRNHIEEEFSQMRAFSVTTDSINAYIEKRQKEGADNATINRELALLRRAFRLAYNSTPRKVHEVPSFSLLVEKPPRKGFIDDAQYAVLCKHCPEPWLRAMLAAAYAFGFRVGELVSMRVRQIDMLNETITLDAGTTKNDEGRTVKMTREVFDLLVGCVRGKGSEDFVFTREDGSQVKDFRGAWHAMCVQAGLGQLTCPKCSQPFTGKSRCAQCGAERRVCRPNYDGLLFHDLRRSAVRNLVRDGVPETVAMKISGHKTRAVFDRYDICSDRDIADAARKYDERRKLANDKSTTKVDFDLTENLPITHVTH